jgi:HSP20 family molecular chaperone IbpA
MAEAQNQKSSRHLNPETFFRGGIQSVREEFTKVTDRVSNFVTDWRSYGEQKGMDLVDKLVGYLPRADLIERENEYLLQIDMPGFSANELDLTFEKNTLKISGERKGLNLGDKERFFRIERVTGKFKRTFSLPLSFVPERIEAHLKDGVLNISMSKDQSSKTHKSSEKGSKSIVIATDKNSDSDHDKKHGVSSNTTSDDEDFTQENHTDNHERSLEGQNIAAEAVWAKGKHPMKSKEKIKEKVGGNAGEELIIDPHPHKKEDAREKKKEVQRDHH